METNLNSFIFVFILSWLPIRTSLLFNQHHHNSITIFIIVVTVCSCFVHICWMLLMLILMLLMFRSSAVLAFKPLHKLPSCKANYCWLLFRTRWWWWLTRHARVFCFLKMCKSGNSPSDLLIIIIGPSLPSDRIIRMFLGINPIAGIQIYFAQKYWQLEIKGSWRMEMVHQIMKVSCCFDVGGLKET